MPQRPVTVDNPFRGMMQTDADQLPDATWVICKIHNAARSVDERGNPAVGGVCEHCQRENNDPSFFKCPFHGTNPKLPGQEGCPAPGCLGKSIGATAEQIEAEGARLRNRWRAEDRAHATIADAERVADVQAGRTAAQQAHVDAGAAGPETVGGGGAGAGGEGEPGRVRGPDRVAPDPFRDVHDPDAKYVIVVDPAADEPTRQSRLVDRWSDPFLIDET